MPLPLIIGGIAVAAGLTGVGSGIHGGIKMKEANDTMQAAKSKQERSIKKFEENNTKTTQSMDKLGKKELEILASFERFSNLLEKIQGRPEFKEIQMDGVNLPEYQAEELKEVSAAAGAILGGIGGAAVGTAGGFAAAGATTSAVMALGTASTGTAISTLSGAAATNAALAALGGGSLATGGGGMALGATILSGATLGVGLLVGGVIFNATGNKLSEKADEAWEQAKRTEKEVEKIIIYLKKLKIIADNYYEMLDKVCVQYSKYLDALEKIVCFEKKTEWEYFTSKEKLITENTVLLVGLLYKMCKVKLVIQNPNPNGQNRVNESSVKRSIDDAKKMLTGKIKNIELDSKQIQKSSHNIAKSDNKEIEKNDKLKKLVNDLQFKNQEIYEKYQAIMKRNEELNLKIDGYECLMALYEGKIIELSAKIDSYSDRNSLDYLEQLNGEYNTLRGIKY